MSDNLKPILLVGCGYMGYEYSKVLDACNIDYITIGRGETSANEFYRKTGKKPYIGGVKRYIEKYDKLPEKAIVAVGVDELYETTCLLIQRGVEEILIEKPGAVTYEQIADLAQLAATHNTKVFIAYNRRFYASVRKAKELILEDGGVSSLFFEFTEWSHKIQTLDKSPSTLENWFLCNSTHVVDLAFYLGGLPKVMTNYVSGTLKWHRKASNYSGAGQLMSGGTFSYRADWESAGRWSIEIMTKSRKIILCPLEELKVQPRGTLTINEVPLENTLDLQFKPGLYLQIQAFLNQEYGNLVSVDEQVDMCQIYKKIELGQC